MEQLHGYDAWLEAPYTNQSEACEHECDECGGVGTLDDVKCDYCDGRGECEGDCEPPEPPEPDYDWEPDYGPEDE